MDLKVRAFSGDRVIWLFCLCVFAIPVIHWYRQHARETRQRDAERVQDAANRSEFDSAVRGIKVRWQTDDSWEGDLLKGTQSLDPYTINFEQALVKGHPLLFYGTVTDIQTTKESGVSVVLVRVHGRSVSLRLQLSLSASREQTAAIMSNDSFRQYLADELSMVCVFVASIDGIKRVEASDKQGDDISYFVAHGTLLDAYASKVYGSEFFH